MYSSTFENRPSSKMSGIDINVCKLSCAEDDSSRYYFNYVRVSVEKKNTTYKVEQAITLLNPSRNSLLIL